MKPRKITLFILALVSIAFAEDLIIHLKNFPRPTMVANRLKGDIIIDGYINDT